MSTSNRQRFIFSSRRSASDTHIDRRKVHENVLAPVLWSDEAKSFRLVEPFDVTSVRGSKGHTNGASSDSEFEEMHCTAVREAKESD